MGVYYEPQIHDIKKESKILGSNAGIVLSFYMFQNV
jgi:hypothetical protein